MTARLQELYSFWRSSAVYRVRVACAIKGLKVPEHFIDLDHGGQHDEEFRRINPMGAVPALVVEGADQPLTQSLAILEYLDETHPTPALLPREPLARARVRAIAQTLAADTHPLITPRVRAALTKTAGFDAAQWKSWQAHWLVTGLQALENRLTRERDTGRFCHGDNVTIADICLCSVLAVAEVFAIEVPNIPKIRDIAEQCGALDAFAKAAPLRQEGAPTR